MRLVPGLLILASLLLLTACSESAPEPQLRSFEADYLGSLYQFRPTVASRSGVHQFDGRLDDLSSLAIGRRTDDLSRMLVRLRSLQTAEMSAEEEAESKVLEYALRRELARWNHLSSWRKNPLLYLDVPLMAFDNALHWNYATASERLKAVVISVNEIEAVLAAMRANLTEPSRPLVEAGTDRCRQLELLLEGDLPDWGRKAAGIDVRLQRSFEAGAELALEGVRESLKWLEADALPRASESSALGAENFIVELLLSSMVEMRLSELEQMADDALARDTKMFLDAASRVAPGREPSEALRLAQMPAIPPEERVDAGQRAVEAIRRFVSRTELVPLPPEIAADPGYRLLLMPPYRRTPADPHQFDPPPVEGNDPKDGLWMLGTALAGWTEELKDGLESRFSEAELQLDAIYHALPGLYLHSLYTAGYRGEANRSLPERVVFSRVTRRGWAHYAEEMMWEQGFGKNDPKIELLLWRRALIRDCRFLAAVKFHVRGTALRQVQELFEERAYLPPAIARLEARRVAGDPLCLSDALGKELILNLREKYRAQQDGVFTPGGFHREFLKYAPLPLPLLEGMMVGGP